MSRSRYGLLAAALSAALVLLFLYSVAEVLLLLFVAVLFSLYLGAITDALERHLRLPRPAGIATALLLTALALVGLGFLIIPPVAQQTHELLQALPAALEALESRILAIARRSRIAAQLFGPLEEGQSYVGNILQQIGSYVRNVVPYVFSGVQFLIHLVSVLVMGIYLALRPALYREGLLQLVPPVHRELVRDILADLGQTLRAWIVGQLLAMVSLGALTWIGLEILDVPYALAFGVFTGAVAIVPFFGTLVSTLLPALFVLGSGGLLHALLVAGLGVVVHLVEANVIAPLIMERQVRLPPVLTMLSVLIMAHLLHVIGLLVAVPILATAMVLVRRIYVYRILEGQGFRRTLRDRPIELALPTGDDVAVHPAGPGTSIPAVLEQE